MYGGSQFTDFLRDLLAQGGNAWPTTAGRDIAEDIKQKICYVASDPQTEANPPIKYTIPSTGEEIRVGDERWKCTEPLFEPSPIIGNNALGVHQMLFESIMASPLDIQRTLSQNIVLSGGTSSFPGFADRLSKQVEPLFKSNEFKITAPPEPQLLSWRGGSVMAEMPGFQRGCMTTAEYDEFGPELVHKKAF